VPLYLQTAHTEQKDEKWENKREMRDERARRGKGKDMQEQICATAF